MLEQAAQKYPDIVFLHVDVTSRESHAKEQRAAMRALVKEWGARSLPSTLFFKDGVRTGEAVFGLIREQELEQYIKHCLKGTE